MVVSPLKFKVKLNPQCNNIGPKEYGPEEGLRDEGRRLMRGSRSLTKGLTEGAPPFCPVSFCHLRTQLVFIPSGGCSNRVPAGKQTAALSRQKTYWSLDLGLQSSEQCEMIFCSLEDFLACLCNLPKFSYVQVMSSYYAYLNITVERQTCEQLARLLITDLWPAVSPLGD